MTCMTIESTNRAADNLRSWILYQLLSAQKEVVANILIAKQKRPQSE